MKKISFALFAWILVSLIACNRNDDNSSSISTTAVTNTVVSGTWRITYYWDTDHDETNNFTGYSFTFASGGAITAAKTGSTVSGTWNTALDDSKTKLVLNFATPASFAELSDDWHVIERTDVKIRLQDVSGGNGGTDFLTFEKN